MAERESQWDLGEFDQKGSIATRWGTKQELVEAAAAAKQHGVDILIDAVINVGPRLVSSSPGPPLTSSRGRLLVHTSTNSGVIGQRRFPLSPLTRMIG